MASSIVPPLPNFYVYYSEFQLLLCKVCRLPIRERFTQSHALKHMTEHEFTEGLVDQALRGRPIKSIGKIWDQIRATQHPINSFSELPIRDGYQCGAEDCRDLFTSAKSLFRHLAIDRRYKRSEKDFDALIRKVQVQGLSHDRFLFEVHPPPLPGLL
jgi:hypothetical protein